MTKKEIKRQFDNDCLLKEQDSALVSMGKAKKRYDYFTSLVIRKGLLSYKEFCESFTGKCFGRPDLDKKTLAECLKVLGYADYKYCKVLYVKKNSVTVDKKMFDEDFFDEFKEIPESDFNAQLNNKLAEFLTF